MNSSIEHIQSVNKLADYCKQLGLTIFEHEYNYMAFGSWVLVIGKDKHRIKFNWDGKESYLGVAASKFQNSNSLPSWEPVLSSVGDTSIKQENVFSFIEETLEKQYAI